jgi:hypothetical protein
MSPATHFLQAIHSQKRSWRNHTGLGWKRRPRNFQTEDHSCLRESQSPYDGNFGDKNDGLSSENARLWDICP